MAKKQKSAELVLEQGLAASLDEAKKLIMAGRIFYKYKNSLLRVDKPGQLIDKTAELSSTSPPRFVSRGGYKLLTAIENFELPINDSIAIDAGASTGGFTDCLLQYGAKKVYAIDVGKNLLHEKLKNDPKVINLEGINLRCADTKLISDEVDIIVTDVSFISLKLILPPVIKWLKPSGYVIALIKPQFEAEPGECFDGVVKDELVQKSIVNRILGFAEQELNLNLKGVVPAAIKGPKGNQEYIAVWQTKN